MVAGGRAHHNNIGFKNPITITITWKFVNNYNYSARFINFTNSGHKFTRLPIHDGNATADSVHPFSTLTLIFTPQPSKCGDHMLTAKKSGVKAFREVYCGFSIVTAGKQINLMQTQLLSYKCTAALLGNVKGVYIWQHIETKFNKQVIHTCACVRVQVYTACKKINIHIHLQSTK